MAIQVVIDTNVFLSALRSRRGASFRLLSLIGHKDFEINVSVPLVAEYEDVAKRVSREVGLAHSDVDDILDYICRVANRRQIYFLWRPYLRDSYDDLVLELAVEAECDFIITYNLPDFAGAERFGVKVITPKEFLKKIGALS
ncbi:MAG: putative toxin-antitoxin system toxin component, PIN family [Candidatus Manganitrophaceae bacterium]